MPPVEYAENIARTYVRVGREEHAAMDRLGFIHAARYGPAMFAPEENELGCIGKSAPKNTILITERIFVGRPIQSSPRQTKE